VGWIGDGDLSLFFEKTRKGRRDETKKVTIFHLERSQLSSKSLRINRFNHPVPFWH
jgi:hypothetical protein